MVVAKLSAPLHSSTTELPYLLRHYIGDARRHFSFRPVTAETWMVVTKMSAVASMTSKFIATGISKQTGAELIGTGV